MYLNKIQRKNERLNLSNIQVIADTIIENLYQVCHSGSYEKLATTVKVDKKKRNTIFI